MFIVYTHYHNKKIERARLNASNNINNNNNIKITKYKIINV